MLMCIPHAPSPGYLSPGIIRAKWQSRCQPTGYGYQLLCSAFCKISHYKRCLHFRNYTEYIVLYYSNLSITYCVAKVRQLAKRITYIESAKPDNISGLPGRGLRPGKKGLG